MLKSGIVIWSAWMRGQADIAVIWSIQKLSSLASASVKEENSFIMRKKRKENVFVKIISGEN